MTTTTINGYRVTLTPATSDTPSQCWIAHGRFSASLSYLLYNAELHSEESGVNLPLSIGEVEDIYEWASANGY